MNKTDLPAVLRIERASETEDVWTSNDFVRHLGKRTLGAVVAVDDAGDVLGYLAFHVQAKVTKIANVTVAKDHRRKGVGSTLVLRLAHVKGRRSRPRLTATVRESNLGAQLFFRALSFRCDGIVPNAYDSPKEPGYLFIWETTK